MIVIWHGTGTIVATNAGDPGTAVKLMPGTNWVDNAMFENVEGSFKQFMDKHKSRPGSENTLEVFRGKVKSKGKDGKDVEVDKYLDLGDLGESDAVKCIESVYGEDMCVTIKSHTVNASYGLKLDSRALDIKKELMRREEEAAKHM